MKKVIFMAIFLLAFCAQGSVVFGQNEEKPCVAPNVCVPPAVTPKPKIKKRAPVKYIVRQGKPGKNGKPGNDGSSCTVFDNGNGTSTLSCTDKTSVIIKNGEKGDRGDDGVSCSVRDNENGSGTITCGETSLIIRDGEKGDKGDKGDDGKPGKNAGGCGLSCKIALALLGTAVVVVAVKSGGKGGPPGRITRIPN